MTSPARLSPRAKWPLYATWIVLSGVAALWLAQKMLGAKTDKSLFLPGKTTHGHHQIELECGACHRESFSGAEGLQAACLDCHAAELEQAEDSHPESKFSNPRNADRVKELDARLCVTCHAEHLPERTDAMGLSLPLDYCYQCHQDIAEERPSHEGLAFDSCANAGCHNFHDNTALYEDFLAKHATEGPLLAQPFRPSLDPEECPAPERHQPGTAAHEKCATCHQEESRTWLQGRHGMRVAQGLEAVRPSESRLPMASGHPNDPLSCFSCHAREEPNDLLQTGVESCLSCHSDEHSLAYKRSVHYRLLLQEVENKIAKGSGVACSTCHMPALEDENGNLVVDHNQNANLRPNEKMLRTSCTTCHGVAFSLDALADPKLVRNNFSASPTIHVPSVDWAAARN